MSQMVIRTDLLERARAAQAYAPPLLDDPPSGFRGPMMAVLVFSIGLMSYWGEESISTELAYLSQFIVGLLAVMVVANMFLSGVAITFSREWALMFLFLVWGFAGMPFALSGAIAQEGLVTVAKLLLMSMVILNMVNGPRSYQWFMGALLSVSVVAAMLGITGISAGGGDVVAAGKAVVRYKGVFGNPNGLAQLMCLGLWGASALLLSIRSKTPKLILIAAMAFSVVIVGATGSKQGMLALFLGVIATYWFVLRKISRSAGSSMLWLVLIVVVMGLIVAYLSTTFYWERIEKFFGFTEGGRHERSDEKRLEFMLTSISTAIHNPLMGVGYDCVKLVIGNILKETNPHNTIASLAANTGFVGWGLFFGAWLSAVLRMRKASKLPLPREVRVLLLSGWVMHTMLGLWSFTAFLPAFKPFWACMAANVAYSLWVEKTFKGRAAPPAGAPPGSFPAAYPIR